MVRQILRLNTVVIDSHLVRSLIDLSHWRVAYCGAEPIQNASVERFSTAFSCYGYNERAFYPVFGMAEHTLICSAGPVGELYQTLVCNRDKLVKEMKSILSIPRMM